LKAQVPSSKHSHAPKAAGRTARFWSLKLGASLVFGVWCGVLCGGCRQEMFDQPRTNPVRASEFFPDGAAAQPLPPHTVARGFRNDDEALHAGAIGTNLITEFPFRVTRETLERGRERFDIYCAACHGRTGEGNGMIVQRGFPAPPSYHTERLRNAPVGHLYDVMTRGYGLMYSQASRVAPTDRWAIAAYIRALQLSHNARLADASSGQRTLLEASR
jgi:mono/diheme cytochrome c family protein